MNAIPSSVQFIGKIIPADSDKKRRMNDKQTMGISCRREGPDNIMLWRKVPTGGGGQKVIMERPPPLASDWAINFYYPPRRRIEVELNLSLTTRFLSSFTKRPTRVNIIQCGLEGATVTELGPLDGLFFPKVSQLLLHSLGWLVEFWNMGTSSPSGWTTKLTG